MKYVKGFYKEDKIAEEKNKYKVLCNCGTKTVMATVDKRSSPSVSQDALKASRALA